MKPWYKSKTVWFNILATSAPIVGYLATNEGFMQSVLSPTRFAVYSAFIGLANVALRAVTTQGVSFFQDHAITSPPSS